MIVVDTSAIIAILEGEEDADKYIQALEEDDNPIMSAATFVELCAVMKHKGGQPTIAIINRFFEVSGITIEPFSKNQSYLARDAYFTYGILNLGDCFAYALAKDKNIPLLFKGDDFYQTDITPCIPR